VKAIAAALLLALAPIGARAGEEPAWDCHHTSIVRNFGGSAWRVYACDATHMALVSEPGSAAAPYAFQLDFTDDGVVVSGTGQGDRKAADAAYADIAKLSDGEVKALLAGAMAQR